MGKTTDFPGSRSYSIISELCDFQSPESQFPYLPDDNDNGTLHGRAVEKIRDINNMKPSAPPMEDKRYVTHACCRVILFIVMDTPGATVPQSCHLLPARLADCAPTACLPPLSTRHGCHHGGFTGLSLFWRGPPTSGSCSHTIHPYLPEGTTSLGGSLTPRMSKPARGTRHPAGSSLSLPGCFPICSQPYSLVPKAQTLSTWIQDLQDIPGEVALEAVSCKAVSERVLITA